MNIDKKLRLASVNKESIVDGEGLRYVIYEQGCSHKCPGCHNPETHDFKGGKLVTIKKILEDINKNPLIEGITLSGGDPFFQAKNNIILMQELKKKEYNIWVYTGFRMEEFLEKIDGNSSNEKITDYMIEMLRYADIVVDGRFEEKNKSLLCKFRGSTNQRIIDVKKTLDTKVITEIYK